MAIDHNDLTRKQRRDAARAEREAVQQREEARARRGRRMRQLAGVVVAVAVVIAVVVLVAPHGKDKGIATGSQSSSLVTAVNAELAGIPQSGSRLGSPKAPVRMDYYGDLECPVCQAFTEGGLADTVADEVRGGKLQVTYRSLQTATPDPTTFSEQQAAALAAGRQNRLWQFVELFYRQQGAEGTPYVDDTYLGNLAGQTAGLDRAAWERARTGSDLQDAVRADATAAGIAGADATPTLVFKGPGGTKKLTGNAGHDAIQGAIRDVS